MACFRSGTGAGRSPRRPRGCFVVPAEPLERRTMLSAQPGLVTVGITPGSSAAGLTYDTRIEDEGGARMIRLGGTILAPLDGPAVAAAAPAAQSFDIVLNPGPGLLADPAAAAAFEQAAQFLESRFSDPITVTIDADVRPLGGNTLGQASSVNFGQPFDAIRDKIVADANPQDESFVSQLPTEGSFLSSMPGGFNLNGMSATRANLLALGFSPTEFPGAPSAFGGEPVDATLIFSSDFPFDYDRGNGIQPGLSDFVGVAIHEICHALGFNSAVDNVDGRAGGDVSPMPLDLFRFRPGAGGLDFAGGTRVLSAGDLVADQVLYDGGIFDPSSITQIAGLRPGDIPLSTGAIKGDHNQASHWKDDGFIGHQTIGLMDPVATVGTQQVWTAADERALALVGWDAAPAAIPARVSGTVYQDNNGNGAYEPAGGDNALPNATVYVDSNNNGQYDNGLAERFAPGDQVPLGIPDPGVVESTITVDDLPGTVRDVNVTLDIQHPYTYDLSATLISPTGRSVLLFDNVGGDPFASEDFTGTTFDDEAVDPIELGDPPFRGGYIPQEPLTEMDGETMNGVWRLRVRDYEAMDEGTLLNWSLTFDTGNAEPNTISQGDGTYELGGLEPGTYRVRQVLFDGFSQTQPSGNAAQVVTLAEGQQVTGRNFGSINGVPPALVVGRRIFYNNSLFDGFAAAVDARDDNAIATDKQVLLPGEAASPANYTSYTRGINGLMIDVAGLPADAVLSASDFTFRAGNDPLVGGWQELAVSPEVSVRRGAGADGSDRVELTWPDGAVVRRWLQVTMNATSNTALISPDVFYVGNLPGESGNSSSAAAVDAQDLLAVRSGLNGSARPVSDRLDFNRDGRVNANDFAAARAGMGT
jgi:subtilisin-like proprotein convertase family protein